MMLAWRCVMTPAWLKAAFLLPWPRNPWPASSCHSQTKRTAMTSPVHAHSRVMSRPFSARARLRRSRAFSSSRPTENLARVRKQLHRQQDEHDAGGDLADLQRRDFQHLQLEAACAEAGHPQHHARVSHLVSHVVSHTVSLPLTLRTPSMRRCVDNHMPMPCSASKPPGAQAAVPRRHCQWRQTAQLAHGRRHFAVGGPRSPA